jgi:hypothetical protein
VLFGSIDGHQAEIKKVAWPSGAAPRAILVIVKYPINIGVTAMSNSHSFERIEGSCHCGNLKFTFDWPDRASEIPVRACGCGLCTKHKAVWTSHARGCFSLAIGDEDQLNRYRFGTKTADFHVCRACGVMPITTCVIDSKRYAVVNIHAFDGVDQARLIHRATNWEGETIESRLARRQRTWTPEATTSLG